VLAKLVSRANTASTCVETVAANGIKVATPGCCAKSVCNCSVTSTGDPCTGGTPGCFSAICRGGQGGTPKADTCCVSDGTNGTANGGEVLPARQTAVARP